MTPSVEMLSDLLPDLFEMTEFHRALYELLPRRFVQREIINPTIAPISTGRWFDETLNAIRQRGLLNQEFVDGLTELRPASRDDFDMVQEALWLEEEEATEQRLHTVFEIILRYAGARLSPKRLRRLLTRLRESIDDAEARITSQRRGSIILTIEARPGALARLRDQFHRERLADLGIFGLRFLHFTTRRARGLKVVSVVNDKGGVGKTSITANLGAELAFRGKKVLLIDLASQAGLTHSFLKPQKWAKRIDRNNTIKEWFDVQAEEPVSLVQLIATPRNSPGGQLHLIAAHPDLSNVALSMAVGLSEAFLPDASREHPSPYRHIEEALKSLEGQGYDVVLIDCPPDFNILTRSAIVASDYLLIPAKPDYLSTLGIRNLLHRIDEVTEAHSSLAAEQTGLPSVQPELLGVVFNMVMEREGEPIVMQRPYIDKLRQSDIPVFDTYIKESKKRFLEGAVSRQPVVLSRAEGRTHQRIVLGLEDLTTELMIKAGL